MAPHQGWVKRTFTGPRPWENNDAEPFSDVADYSRGELRLAAEVALAVLGGRDVPTFAHDRAVATLQAVAS